MPNIHDDTFDRTVTLVCMNDAKGSFGLTINRPIDLPFEDILKQLNLPHSNKALNEKTILLGGPVESGQGYVLHDGDTLWQNTRVITDNLFITSSRDILEDIVLDNGPENFLIALGSAQWAPQQLEDELMSNAWLTCPVETSLLFELPYEQRWEASAKSIGVDLNRISYHVGHD